MKSTADATSGGSPARSTPARGRVSSCRPWTCAVRAQQLGGRQRVVDLQRAAEVEPLGDLPQVGAGEVAVEDVADGRADDVAGDVVGAAQLAFVLELELAGDRRQRGVDVGDARHGDRLAGRSSARRSAFETTFSSSEIGSRWLTPERLSTFLSSRAWNAISSTISRT